MKNFIIENNKLMEIKDTYYFALQENDGKINEIELGELLGLNEDETQRIIAQLLMEHKIEFLCYGACNYSIIKKKHNY